MIEAISIAVTEAITAKTTTIHGCSFKKLSSEAERLSCF